MLDTLNRLLAPAAMQRATLLANHVLASEPVAMQRMAPHAGKRLRVDIAGLPAWLPPLPVLAFVVTPAGLLEWLDDAGEASLVLRVDAAEATAIASTVLAGERPPVTIEGDAALAADVGWLLQNLRWDLAADLERFLPAAVVQQLVVAGRALRSALSRLVDTLRRNGPAPLA